MVVPHSDVCLKVWDIRTFVNKRVARVSHSCGVSMPMRWLGKALTARVMSWTQRLLRVG